LPKEQSFRDKGCSDICHHVHSIIPSKLLPAANGELGNSSASGQTQMRLVNLQL
jgi:hypothetical protein